MKFKKNIAFLIISIFILAAFTGCTSSKYNKAVNLMNSGNYEEAKEIFVEIKDYKDSTDLINECNWEIIFDYYSNTYRKMNSSAVFEICTTSNGDGLDITYFLKSSDNGLTAKLSYIIKKDNLQSLNVNSEIDGNTSGLNITTHGTTMVDLSKYRTIDSLNWNISDLIFDSQELKDTFSKLADNIFQTTYLLFEESLKESELEITFKDLGIS